MVRTECVRESVIRLFLVVVSLVICEVFLWAIGYPVWRRSLATSQGPKHTSPHSTLGWYQKPGKYSYVFGGRKISVTISPHHDRISSSESATLEYPTSIGFFGGSFVAGWGLSDQETFTSQLASADHTKKYFNYGVANFGTIQTYLWMKMVIQESYAPETFIYLFNELHEDRNIGGLDWTHSARWGIDRQQLVLPVGEIAPDGEFIISPLDKSSLWKMSSYSRVVALIEEVYRRVLLLKKMKHKEEVALATMKNMSQLAQEHTKDFFIAFYHVSNVKKERYLARLRRYGIKSIDCSFPEMYSENFTLSDGHPNAKANARLAECFHKETVSG